MLSSLDHVFRLKAWTIRHQKGGWYVSSDDHPKKWGRKYRSLRSATTAIARFMEKEFVERAARLQ